MASANAPAAAQRPQVLIGVGVFVVGALMAWGAMAIPSEAGYAGVGPNFMPFFVAAALMICGAWLVWEACTGGYRDLEAATGAEQGDWRALLWVSSGVLANAALITHAGFVLSCSLCYLLAVRGLRISEGKAGGGARTAVQDAAIGLAISAPVYWLFTKLLAINLPGLTATGWL